MANVNKTMLLGNLTRDPEVRYTPKGTAVAELGMAINRNRTGENGEKIEDVTYVDVTLWGKQAELAGKYLAKGRSVFIEGRLQLDQWDDKKTGEKRSRLRVVGENMQFIGGKPDGGKGASEPSSRRQENGPPRGEAYDKAAAAHTAGPTTTEIAEDDIPF